MSEPPRPPELTATQSSRGWRAAAVVVAVSIVGLVVATRLGAPAPEPQRSPPATVLAAAPSGSPTSSPDPARPTGPTPIPPLSIGGWDDEVAIPPGARYVDGIPAVIEGSRVFRVHEALSAPVGTTLMIGGWHVRRECGETRRRRCALPTIADTRLDTPRMGGLSTDWLAMDLGFGRNGAYVVWGRLEEDPRCSIRRAGSCQLRLHVGDLVWPI